METLIRKYQVSCEDIDQMYIAGGFGYKLDIEKAVQIGLLPEECKEKITQSETVPCKARKRVWRQMMRKQDGKVWSDIQRKLNWHPAKNFRSFIWNICCFRKNKSRKNIENLKIKQKTFRIYKNGFEKML